MSTETRSKPVVDETPIEWVVRNQQALIIGAVVIIVAVVLGWFVMRSNAQREALASEALQKAKQDAGVGNIPLAQSDLKRLTDGYGNTSPGAEGAMMLATMNYDQADFAGGIKGLQDELGKAPKTLRAEIQDLIGDGYVGQHKPADAAKAYEAAAGLTNLTGQRASERSKAAQSYKAAGDTAAARSIWSQLADDPSNPEIGAEARVRLGELMARPIQKS